MSIMTRSFDIKNFDNSLAEVTFGEANRPDSPYKQIVDMKSSSISPIKTGVKTHRVIGLGPLEDMGETTPINFDTAFPGPTKESYYEDFGLAVAFSKNFIADELYGIAGDIAKELGTSYDLHRNIKVARLYENFYATTYYTGDDSLALGSAAHTSYAGGAVRANILAVPKPLSYDGVQDLLVLAHRQTDDRGNPAPGFKGNASIKVLIQPEDKPTYLKLFAGGNGLDPTNYTNSPNVLKHWGATFTPVVNEYINKIGTSRYWFMLAPETHIWLVDREPLTHDTYVENGNKAVVYDVSCRYVIHPKRWTGVYGSGN